MNALIERLLDTFGAPDRGRPEGFLREVAKLTDHFGEAVHEKAGDSLIRSAGARWPAPKAIVDACVEAQETIGATTKGVVLPVQKWPWELDAERSDKWAKEYCKQTGIGLRAFTDGWGRQLLQWARSYAREHYRRGSEPSLDARPSSDEIKYWKEHCRCPPHSIGQEREWLLGPVDDVGEEIGG